MEKLLGAEEGGITPFYFKRKRKSLSLEFRETCSPLLEFKSLFFQGNLIKKKKNKAHVSLTKRRPELFSQDSSWRIIYFWFLKPPGESRK